MARESPRVRIARGQTGESRWEMITRPLLEHAGLHVTAEHAAGFFQVWEAAR